MTQSKLLEFLENIGICMSTGHLSHLLIKNHQEFEREKEEICEAGLASSPWQHLKLPYLQIDYQDLLRVAIIVFFLMERRLNGNGVIL